MTKTVIALFKTQSESQKAVQELVNLGLPQDRIDISKGYMPAKEAKTTRNAEDKDSIRQFFDSLFGDDTDSKRLSEVARSCGSIVTVHAVSAEEANRAAQTLDQAGAANLDELEQMCGESTVSQQRVAQTNQHQPQGVAQNKIATGTSIPVIEEDVQIEKREVETGGVRVRSRIVERPVEENLRLRQEHILVERNPMARPATQADFGTFREGEAEFVEHKEVPIINKEAKVVEEVRIGKEVEQRQQVVRETERKTEVDVQQLNSVQQPNRPNRNQ